MTKKRCVNPCGICYLFDRNNNQIGECLDTPNNFAAACKIDERIFKGITWYQFFGKKERFCVESDIQSRMRWLNDEDMNYHKQYIKIY